MTPIEAIWEQHPLVKYTNEMVPKRHIVDKYTPNFTQFTIF